MNQEPWEEHGRSHGQERADGRNTHHSPDNEILTANEMAAEAVSNQEVEDDYVVLVTKPGE
jgi:hypothetical protein